MELKDNNESYTCRCVGVKRVQFNAFVVKIRLKSLIALYRYKKLLILVRKNYYNNTPFQ